MGVKERVGAGALAALLGVVGSGSTESKEPTPIIQSGVMPSQQEIDLSKDETLVPDEGLNNLETISIDLEKEKEVNQRFADFLNSEGKYNEAEINKKTIDIELRSRDLGFYAEYGDCAPFFVVQSILLHYESGEIGQYLALGIKDKKGERKIVVTEWPTKLWEKIEGGFKIGVLNSGEQVRWLNSNEETSNMLKERVGTMVHCDFLYDDRINKQNKSYMEHLIKDGELECLEYSSSKKSISLDFAAGLLQPDKKNRYSTEDKFLKKINKLKTTIKGISNLSEMKRVIENKDKECPVVYSFGYNIWEKPYSGY